MLSIENLINNQSVLNPDKIAVKHGERTFTYKQVNEISNQLALFLIDQNIIVGDVIGIAVDRSPEMIILLLAFKKAGAAYLPIDNEIPNERIKYMLDDSSVKLLITSKNYRDKYKDILDVIYIEDALEQYINYDAKNLEPKSEDNLAYILYTSGSTGKPKGVGIKHSNLLNLLLSILHSPGIDENDILLSTTTISFDIAELEFYLPLICGAKLVIADAETVKDARELLSLAKAEKVTIMQGAPYMWRMMIESGWVDALPIKIFCGGEAMTRELAEKLLIRCKSLWNMYGPTETTIYSTIKNVTTDDNIITIGKPILNTQIYILDNELNEVDKGAIGEICIGGAGVADGYINRPELTAEKFIYDKFSAVKGQKIYRTGDLGKVLDNGEIQCLGRIDHQIKIRGIRIESEEIEESLKAQTNIKHSVIVSHKDALNNTHLVAYVVPVSPIKANDEDIFIKIWKTGLRVTLPDYMVPDIYIIIPSLPLMLNGKLDHKALPPPTIKKQDKLSFVSPQTPTEISLAEIFVKNIAINEIGLNDNFFDFGIDSLIAVSMMVQIENKFGKRLPLSILRKHPTIKQLASAIQNHAIDSQYKILVPLKPSGTKVPLYIIHGNGLNLLNLHEMILNIDSDQPVYGLQSIGLDGTMEVPDNLEAIARFYNDEILKHNPQGPYAIAGYSFGGFIAFEMVRQLKEMGKEVKLLAMFDTNLQYPTYQYPLLKKINIKVVRQFKKAGFRTCTIFTQPIEAFKYITIYYDIKFRLFFKNLGFFKDYHPDNLPDFMQEIVEKLDTAFYTYKVRPLDIKITLFKAKIKMYFVDDPNFLGWGDYALEGVETYEVPGDHKDMFGPANAKILAKTLQSRLDQINN